MDAVIKPVAETLGVEASTLLAWTVRLVLPVLFFAAWTWLNREKSSQAPWDRTGKQGHVVSKDQLLAGRRGSPRGKGEGVPKEFATLRTEASPAGTPASTPTAQDRGGARERRRRASPTSGGTKGAPLGAGPLSRRLAKDPSQEKARLESLLNHVAFSRTKKSDGRDEGDNSIPPKVTSEAKQANDEARRVLKAAVAECLGPRCAEIARDVFRGLEEKQVGIEAATFTLLIDVSIAAEDLSGVSDFLQRMESDCWPHGPDASLLDRVMGFYSRAKESLDQLPAYQPAAGGDAVGEVAGSLNFGAYSDDE